MIAFEKLQQLTSAKAPVQYRLIKPIHPVQLKHVLCNIHPNSAKIHLGFLPFVTWKKLTILQSGTSMP